MIARLIAILLTLLVGSPVCWCCIACSEAAPAGEDACSKCCEDSPASSDEKPPGKPCPCSQLSQARELTSPDQALPAPSSADPPPARWIAADERFVPAVFCLANLFPARETGPPWPHVPLYHQHCALLI